MANERGRNTVENVMHHSTSLFRFLLALLLIMTGSVCVAADNDPVTVPITLHGTYLYIAVRIDGKPATFVIDSGAGANIITPEAAKRLALTIGGEEAKIIGAAGAGGSASEAKIPALEVGSVLLKDQSAYVVSLPEMLRCDGLLGTPFLRSRVVSIDYERRQLTMTPTNAFKAPAGTTTFRLRFKADTPFVEASADGHKGWFGVDTGAGGGILLFDAFVQKHRLRDERSTALRTPTGRAIGGLVYGVLVRLPEFALGSSRWVRPVTELSQQTKGLFADTKNAGNLGGEIWQRFTVTLDYKHDKMYLVPNALHDKPFNTPRTGLAIDTQNNVRTIIDVSPNSPGAEAGIVAGDIVLAVNGQPIGEIAPWDLAAVGQSAPGTKVRLRLLSANKSEREVTITLRDLL